jgi:nucleoside-diphosphate-sugar epimerase
MIYGAPDDRNIARLLQLLRRVPVLPVPGGGRRLQQPVHVDDLADALLSALTSPAAIGTTYDLAGPRALSFRQLLEESGAAVGRRVRLVPVPLRPCILALRTYERVARRPRLTAEQLGRLSEDKAFDIGPAARDLGYAPREFRDGVAAEAAGMAG